MVDEREPDRDSDEPIPVEFTEHRLLHWRKITDPAAPVSRPPSGVDVRAVLPTGPEFDELCVRLAGAGVPYRQVRYWLEAETVSTIGRHGELSSLRAVPEVSALVDPARPRAPYTEGWSAAGARNAFDMVWEAHAQPHEAEWDRIPATEWVPPEWLPYLPHPTLNPAQAQAAPAVLDDRRHLVVTAPTGAGKTVIGMLAALAAILCDRRKAVWLVPQRSLTDELNRELAGWRTLGLRVEQVSGEHTVDAPQLRAAHLWVATTEKFESLCRNNSLRAALARVGCLVVDEIHLLGDAERGPLLEALLARLRGANSPVRIVGLSATAANAEQVAEWLDAEPIRVDWRPTRLTWQLPVVPASGERTDAATHRTRLATAITRQVTADGSVLVFCGTKRNVRATALAIAADRGAPTDGVSTEDLPQLHRVCASVGVGIHYKDWEYRHEALSEFRARRLDVLVATTTVAAGVNLPARAVIVRDTVIGRNDLNVATVQQMFGRAGRIGTKENEGWAFLITDENEHAPWQAQLVAGYTIRSRIRDCLPDHILAEVAQGGIHTDTDAELWWKRTLAYHQGAVGLDAVHDAIALLVKGGYLTQRPLPDNVTTLLTVTDLGRITTRLMVPVLVGNALRAAFAKEPVPTDPDDAETVLGRLVATTVPELADAPVDEDQRPSVARLLRAEGRLERLGTAPPPPSLVTANACDPGDLARVAFALVAHHPREFTRHRPVIGGVSTSILIPVLEPAPRYFAWLARQGRLGTVHPWVAVVADDLGRRIRWRRLAPPRGAGRLLWICEQMATTLHVDDLVPELFTAARSHDVSNPDWPTGPPPHRCQLNRDGYQALLRDRATDTTFAATAGRITVTCPNVATVSLWTGPDHQVTTPSAGEAVSYPDTTQRGATVFTRRGDHRSHGWLAAYDTISQHA